MMNKSTYTPEEVKLITELHQDDVPIEEIAERVGKSVASVRSKLVKEKAYIKQPKISKKKNGPGKKEIVRDLEEVTGLRFETLIAANKEDLLALLNYIKDHNESV